MRARDIIEVRMGRRLKDQEYGRNRPSGRRNRSIREIIRIPGGMVPSFGEPGTLVSGPHSPKSPKRYPFSGSLPKLRTFRRVARRLYAREFLYILRTLISQKRNAIKTGENGRNPERSAHHFKWKSRRYPLSDSIISRKITGCNFMDRPLFGRKNGPHGKWEKSREIRRKTRINAG